MTNQEINEAVAKYCGFTRRNTRWWEKFLVWGKYVYIYPNGHQTLNGFPDFCTDTVWMDGIVRTLPEVVRHAYTRLLNSVLLRTGPVTYFRILNAGPRDKAEAFVLTMLAFTTAKEINEN